VQVGAGGLLGCLQRLRNFYRAIQNIPEDLQQVTYEIEILGEVLSHIGTFDRGDVATLLKARLARCQIPVLKLETLVTATSKHLNEKKRFQVVQRVSLFRKKQRLRS
jgi:hypothetical protein